NRAISASRINLNITRRSHATVQASSTSRPFELAAAGAAIVSSPVAGIERWFEPGRDLVAVKDGDEADAVYRELPADPSARETVARVIEEIRAFDPGFAIVVVDDGSIDRTGVVAERCGVEVLRLPFNLGIGGAVQTGYQYALDNGFELAVQVDGDGQHNPQEIARLVGPILDGTADMVGGT